MSRIVSLCGSLPLPLVLLLCTLLGCRCSGLQEEVGGLSFTRCAALSPPSSRELRSGPLTLALRERALFVEGVDTLRLSLFQGPVGARFEPADLALLRASAPQLIVQFGGLGESAPVAISNLEQLAALQLPVILIPGGDDRLPVIEEALAAIPETHRELVVWAAGLRELRMGDSRFVLVPGAPLGRYAVDEAGCGLSRDDLREIEASALASAPALHTWLLSWHAPAGSGLSTGASGIELGSEEVRVLAQAVHAVGSVFAFPEVASGDLRVDSFALAVPRLSRVGTPRADGSRRGRAVASLLWSAAGLRVTP